MVEMIANEHRKATEMLINPKAGSVRKTEIYKPLTRSTKEKGSRNKLPKSQMDEKTLQAEPESCDQFYIK